MPERNYLIGVDVGTAGANAVLTNHAEIGAEHASAYEVMTPRPVWAEQWPNSNARGWPAPSAAYSSRPGSTRGRCAP